jgi:hypothetical protein
MHLLRQTVTCTHPRSLLPTNNGPLIKHNYTNLMCSSRRASRHKYQINKAVEGSGAPDHLYNNAELRSWS